MKMSMEHWWNDIERGKPNTQIEDDKYPDLYLKYTARTAQ
jgi:hypothetical protein